MWLGCLLVGAPLAATEPRLENADFDSGGPGRIAGWSTAAWDEAQGRATWQPAGGVDGGPCVRLDAPAANDLRIVQTVRLEPHTAYILRGYIKGRDIVVPADAWVGANLSIYGLYRCASDPERSQGTFDWAPFEVDFATGPSGEAQLACRLGHWSSTVTGTAWFDRLTIERNRRVTRRTTAHFELNLWEEDLAGFTGDHLQRWLDRLDQAYEALASLTGRRPYDGARIGLYTPTWYPGGWAVAGNPILWMRKFVPDVVREAEEHDGSGFGVIHEIGHDFDDGCGWNFDGEFWANFKLHYVNETCDQTVIQGGRPRRGAELDAFWREQYEKLWVGRREMNNDVLQYHVLAMRDRVGWEPFRQTFRWFWAQPPENLPRDRWGRLELFFDQVSAFAGQDVWAVFAADELAALREHYSDRDA